MTVTAAAFRLQFPAFADTARYPDAQVDFYIGLAGKLLIAERWGSLLDEGVSLFAAHFLAVAALPGTAGVAGTFVGLLSGGTVDKVSYTRDIASIMEEDAGHWGMTTFGLQYLRLARMMGTGPMQVGTAYDGSLSALAWAGPQMGPW